MLYLINNNLTFCGIIYHPLSNSHAGVFRRWGQHSPQHESLPLWETQISHHIYLPVNLR